MPFLCLCLLEQGGDHALYLFICAALIFWTKEQPCSPWLSIIQIIFDSRVSKANCNT